VQAGDVKALVCAAAGRALGPFTRSREPLGLEDFVLEKPTAFFQLVLDAPPVHTYDGKGYLAVVLCGPNAARFADRENPEPATAVLQSVASPPPASLADCFEGAPLQFRCATPLLIYKRFGLTNNLHGCCCGSRRRGTARRCAAAGPDCAPQAVHVEDRYALVGLRQRHEDRRRCLSRRPAGAQVRPHVCTLLAYVWNRFIVLYCDSQTHTHSRGAVHCRRQLYDSGFSFAMVSAIFHSGTGSDGHYVAVVKASGGWFIHFNDTLVKRSESLLPPWLPLVHRITHKPLPWTAYLVFYTKRADNMPA
jgi:hypothetical protein